MIIAYWMGNLNNNAERFFICVVIIILVVQCSLAFGSFISAIAPNATAGNQSMIELYLNFSIFTKPNLLNLKLLR